MQYAPLYSDDCPIPIESFGQMANTLVPSLELFPVEILHRIFDSLDAKTILTSLHGTCRRLQTAVNSYKKLVLNCKLISKFDLELVLCSIAPQNVISLTLCNDDETLSQIELFLARFDIEQFSRLRSLNFIGMEESLLKVILKCLNIQSLISLSIKIGKADDRCKKTTVKLLSSIIAETNFRQFDFEIPPNRIDYLNWPVQHMIQHLRIGTYTNFDRISTILQCSPLLETLDVTFPESVHYQSGFSHTSTSSFRQLYSLSLNNLSTRIEDLETLLLVLPSLTHFKLIGSGDFFDGNRWEQFIQTNLPFLNRFELFVHNSRHVQYNQTDVDTIIDLFRTPFWLEHKKWFLTCEYNPVSVQPMKLYSIPICVSTFIYQFESRKTSVSTYIGAIDNEVSVMDNVTNLHLDFKTFIFAEIPSIIKTIRQPLFRQVKKLNIELNYTRPQYWVSFTSTLVNLTAIVQIKYTNTAILEADPLTLADIGSLLQQTPNLMLLQLGSNKTRWGLTLTAEKICSITPSHVQHLVVAIKNFDEIQIVLERLENLSSAKFFFNKKSSSSRILKWLKENKNDSSYRIDGSTMAVWLGKKNIQTEQFHLGAKRIKLTYDHHQS